MWDLSDDATTIFPRGKAGAGTISAVAVVGLSKSRFVTAVRTAEGTLKVISWGVSEDGASVVREADGQAGVISALAACALSSGRIATAVRESTGRLKIILWNIAEDGKPERGASVTGDEITLVSITALGGVRGGGNVVWVLHGQELVLYAHLKMGSIDPSLRAGTPVQAGQKLANVGNSGQSGGPHIHIHALRVPGGVTFEDLVEAGENGTLAEMGPYRPMPLHGIKAVAFSELDKDSPQEFSIADGDGLYWDRMAVWPSLSTPGFG